MVIHVLATQQRNFYVHILANGSPRPGGHVTNEINKKKQDGMLCLYEISINFINLNIIIRSNFYKIDPLREDFKKNGKGNDIGHFSVRPPYPKDTVT